MSIREIASIKKGDRIEWTGNNPCVFEVMKVFKGNPISLYGYGYEDWSIRVKSMKDNHTELISGDELVNIHFLCELT